MPNSAQTQDLRPESTLSWVAGPHAPAFAPADMAAALAQPRVTAHVIRDPASGAIGIGLAGTLSPVPRGPSPVPRLELLGSLPPLYPEWLGNRSFNEIHGTRFAYVAGAMANGIASVDLVNAMATQRMLAFFGAAGLSLGRVEKAIDALQRQLDPQQLPWGANLIHSPAEPALEEAVADLYLRRGVRCVEASAYLALTPAVVRYACSGLHLDPQGRVQRRNHVFAKISRPEGIHDDQFGLGLFVTFIVQRLQDMPHTFEAFELAGRKRLGIRLRDRKNEEHGNGDRSNWANRFHCADCCE